MQLCGAGKEEKGEQQGRDKVGAHRDTRHAVRAEERRSIPPGEDKCFPISKYVYTKGSWKVWQFCDVAFVRSQTTYQELSVTKTISSLKVNIHNANGIFVNLVYYYHFKKRVQFQTISYPFIN
jgi:hypothetical protein